MIEVQIRLFDANAPELPSRDLRVLRITNDGSGTPRLGNYDWVIASPTMYVRAGRVERWKRERGIEALVAHVLEEAVR